MAKAKKQPKTESTGEATTEPKPAAGMSSKAKSAKPAAQAAPAAPTIDPTHAVEAAANLIASGISTNPAQAAPRKESSTFKQLKDSLNKPNGKTIGGLLDKTGNPAGKKSAQPFSPFGKQVGHNQTFGADVSRASVPRRTGG